MRFLSWRIPRTTYHFWVNFQHRRTSLNECVWYLIGGSFELKIMGVAWMYRMKWLWATSVKTYMCTVVTCYYCKPLGWSSYNWLHWMNQAKLHVHWARKFACWSICEHMVSSRFCEVLDWSLVPRLSPHANKLQAMESWVGPGNEVNFIGWPKVLVTQFIAGLKDKKIAVPP